VRGGDGDDVRAALDQSADVRHDAFAVEFAVVVARGGDGCAAEQPEVIVARRPELREFLGGDALDVAQGEQAVEFVVIVHHQQFVDAGVVGEKLVGDGDWVGAELAFTDGLHLLARDECAGDLLGGVARLEDVAGEQADEFAVGTDYGEGAERVALGLDQLDDIAHGLVGRDGDRFLDESVDVILDAADLLELLLLRHVVMDQAQAAVECHASGHARLGDGVHIGRDDREVQAQSIRQLGVERGVSRENLRVKRGKGEVVVRQGQASLGREKGVRRLIKG